MQFLDSDYLKILVKIQDSVLFSFVKEIALMPIPFNPEPSSFAQILYDHLNNVKLLEEYAERKLKDYQ